MLPRPWQFLLSDVQVVQHEGSMKLFCPQVAMGIGYALFLVDPEHPKVKELEVFEPAEAVSQAVNPEADAGGKGESS